MGGRAGERPLGVATARPPVALYVHIPFCLGICPYCDFVVYAGADARGPRNRLERFLAALRTEISLRADEADARFGTSRPSLRSVYIGGGTPSLLPAREIDGMIRLIDDRFGLEAAAEITLEANPGRSDRGDLHGFRSAGVNRLSIGAQSLDDAELRTLGRRHSGADVSDAVKLARSAGYDSISVDLLYDVPTQSVASWERTLAGVTALGVDHVSAYALTLEPGASVVESEPAPSDRLPVSAGARRWRDRARVGQDEDRAVELYERAEKRLSAAGLRWYEISNWARGGHESRHNLAYWTAEPYEAVGPGAHAYDGGTRRRWNAAQLDRYLDALTPDRGAATLPPTGTEELTAEAAEAERAMLSLRLRRGIRLPVADRFRAAVSWGRDHGLLEPAGDALRLTTRGRMLGNELFVQLF